jgi:hypothetical protein
MAEMLKRAVEVLPKRYKGAYRLNGGDLALVGTVGGSTAFVVWIFTLFGIEIPQGAAGFLGAILGLLVARLLKPGGKNVT